ncbi:ankyrin repeat domain-containing protein 37 [Engraulis encrasicolus]|uniref:ankyrin repeat domain-containing protein 37 n=1 Tax=Engraulis encrasicolus TaxID=184585 RepID=UPI002FCF1912
MLLLDDSQVCSSDSLLELGCAVNSSGDSWGQTPAHLAACGGQAFCLLWLLQTGADANHQDSAGETPFHKAARVGSLECLSALVACDAQLDVCNNDGKTAEDLAWHYGFTECGRFLSTLRLTHHRKACLGVHEEGAFGVRPDSCTITGQKRARISPDAQDGKKSRDW